MKTLIACHSFSGKTRKVAQDLQKEINGELTKIEPVKDKWYLFKIWDALRGNHVPIKPCINDLRNYDLLIVCCPVWAGRTPAPLNEYLTLLKNAKDKNLGVLVTSGGNGKQKAAIHIREYLSWEGMNFLGQIRILADDVDKGSYKEGLNLFSKKFQ